MKIREMVKAGAEELKTAGIDDCRFEAEYMLSAALGWERIKILTINYLIFKKMYAVILKLNNYNGIYSIFIELMQKIYYIYFLRGYNEKKCFFINLCFAGCCMH